MRVEVIACDSCGTKFPRKASEIKRSKRHFCNSRCQHDYLRDCLPRKQPISKKRSVMWVRDKCDYCNKGYYALRSSMLRYKKHFCSLECCNKFQSECVPREQQSMFNPNLTDEERRKQRYVARNTRTAIKRGRLKRGNCEVCGQPNAHAHHDDYDKPLEVRWFCQKHHNGLHKEMRNERP